MHNELFIPKSKPISYKAILQACSRIRSKKNVNKLCTWLQGYAISCLAESRELWQQQAGSTIHIGVPRPFWWWVLPDD